MDREISSSAQPRDANEDLLEQFLFQFESDVLKLAKSSRSQAKDDETENKPVALAYEQDGPKETLIEQSTEQRGLSNYTLLEFQTNLSLGYGRREKLRGYTKNQEEQRASKAAGFAQQRRKFFGGKDRSVKERTGLEDDGSLLKTVPGRNY